MSFHGVTGSCCDAITEFDYLFMAQYAVEAEQILTEINMAMRKPVGNKFEGKAINAGFVLEKGNCAKLQKNELAYQFLKKVRGTSEYWKAAKQDCCALLAKLGKPTFFLTLSANETKNVELLQLLTLLLI